jgi:hypothetical protein
MDCLIELSGGGEGGSTKLLGDCLILRERDHSHKRGRTISTTTSYVFKENTNSKTIGEMHRVSKWSGHLILLLKLSAVLLRNICHLKLPIDCRKNGHIQAGYKINARGRTGLGGTLLPLS